MALVADLAGLDLVVEPHELTAGDRKAFRQAIQKLRSSRTTRKASQEAARILAERRQRERSPKAKRDVL